MLFTDTSPLTTLVFARHYHGYALPRLEEPASKSAARYARVFLCADDIPYENSWDRSGEANPHQLQVWTIQELEARQIPFVELRGSLEERIAAAAAHLPV